MIERVELLNFISHSKTPLAIGEGVTVFVGKNGAGKSAVIDGITYALYGKHTRGDNADLVRDGATSAAVTLDFSCRSKHYRVERKLNTKGQLEGSLLSEMLDGTPKELAAGERKQFGESMSGEVTRILGLNYDHMIIAGIIQQGELDSIIDLKSKDLKDLINSAIGIDKLDLAYESMRRVVEAFRATIRNQCGYDDTDVVTLTSKVTEAHGELATSTANFQAAQSEIEALRKKEEGLEGEIKSFEPFKAKAETMRVKRETLVDYVERKESELKEEHKKFRTTIETARSYLQSVAEEAVTGAAIEEATKEQKTSEGILADLSPSIGALEALKRKPSEMEKLIQKCRNALELVEKERAVKSSLAITDARIKEIDSQTSLLHGEVGKLVANRETAEKLVFKNHVCPICGSKVDKINELFDAKAIKRHLREHEETVRKLQEEKEGLEPESKGLTRKVAAIEDASDLLVEQGISTRSDLDRLEREKEELAAKLKDLPKLKKKQVDAEDKKREAERAFDTLRPKLEHINVAKGYLVDHKITSDKDLGLLVKRNEQLGQILQALPKNIRSLREATELELLKSFSIDDYSEQMLREIGELNDEASKFDEVFYTAKTRELENLRKTSIPSKSGDLGNWKSRKEKAEENLDNLKQSLEVIQDVATYVQLLENIRKKVYHRDGAVSSSIRTWALNQISKKASEYARLFEIGVSSITIKESRREMAIECYGARGRVKTTSMSGGEKVSIALALRFALAYLMGGYKLDFIILDEPTVYLDPERKASLVNIISRLGGENGPLKQIIIVTHDNEIFENVDVDAIWRFESSTDGTRLTNGMAN